MKSQDLEELAEVIRTEFPECEDPVAIAIDLLNLAKQIRDLNKKYYTLPENQKQIWDSYYRSVRRIVEGELRTTYTPSPDDRGSVIIITLPSGNSNELGGWGI